MKKRKLGIAFGGGGSKGIAHLGVIKAFEEEGITFDEISGTSAGSIVGALYAYGLKFDEMYQVLKTINMKDIKSGPIFFMPSDTSGIEDLIKSSIGNINFDELAKPLTVVAVDLISGEEVHLVSGNVAKAVAASCAVPGFFKPVDHMGYHLVDGGLQNNIPADLLRQNGCDVVISVDVNHSRGKGTSSTKLLDVLSASIGIMMKSNSLNGKIYSDVVIEPDLQKYNRTKLDGYDEMIEIAYQETKKKMPAIKKMLGLEKTSIWKSIFNRRKKEVLEEKENDILEV